MTCKAMLDEMKRMFVSPMSRICQDVLYMTTHISKLNTAVDRTAGGQTWQ